MIDEDPEIEESPRSGTVKRDGISVRVEIYRLVEGDHSCEMERIAAAHAILDEEREKNFWAF
jgi:hypothetical protein